jgi:hypothetical protein
MSMFKGLWALVGSSVLTACGGGGSINAPTGSANSSALTVGNKIVKTTAEVAKLLNVENFVPKSLVMTDGTYANCTYNKDTNTLIVTPKVPNREAPTDTCTATFVDGSGAKLWPINLNLKSVDNKAPVFVSTLTTPIDITAGTAGGIILPRATDASVVTYSIQLSDGSAIPTDLSFDPATSQLSWTSATTANQTLSYTAIDAYKNFTTMTLKTNLVTPSAPSVTADDTNNTINGWNASTMELSLDGTTWSSTLPDLSGDKTVLVRVKAQGNNPASSATTINFTTNAPIDYPGSASITGPATSGSGAITLGLSANDANGIASWTVTSVRLRNSGISDPAVTEWSWTSTPPATLTTNIGGVVWNTYTYTLNIVDNLWSSTSNQFVVTRN